MSPGVRGIPVSTKDDDGEEVYGNTVYLQPRESADLNIFKKDNPSFQAMVKSGDLVLGDVELPAEGSDTIVGPGGHVYTRVTPGVPSDSLEGASGSDTTPGGQDTVPGARTARTSGTAKPDKGG